MCIRDSYGKDEMTEEDGNRAADLELKFAEMNGWEAESEAAQLLQNLGVKEEQHQKLVGELSNTCLLYTSRCV